MILCISSTRQRMSKHSKKGHHSGTQSGKESKKVTENLAEAIAFITRFASAPTNIGAVFPSSRDLAEAMLHGIELQPGDVVVEYGPGTGAFTELLLERLPEGAEYLGIETAPLEQLAEDLANLTALRTLVVRGFDNEVDALVPPHADDHSLVEALGDMRLIKDDFEVAQLQLAIDYTAKAFADVVRALPVAVEHGERMQRTVGTQVDRPGQHNFLKFSRRNALQRPPHRCAVIARLGLTENRRRLVPARRRLAGIKGREARMRPPDPRGEGVEIAIRRHQ
jgi:SAM-dependent methyltransferase